MQPVAFQEGSQCRPVMVDKHGNLDAAVSRVLGAAAFGTEAANVVTFRAPATKMIISTAGAVGNGGTAMITVNNPAITADSVLMMTIQGLTSTSDSTRVPITGDIKSKAAGQCVIHLYNGDAATTTGAVKVHLVVL